MTRTYISEQPTFYEYRGRITSADRNKIFLFYVYRAADTKYRFTLFTSIKEIEGFPITLSKKEKAYRNIYAINEISAIEKVLKYERE